MRGEGRGVEEREIIREEKQEIEGRLSSSQWMGICLSLHPLDARDRLRVSHVRHYFRDTEDRRISGMAPTAGLVWKL